MRDLTSMALVVTRADRPSSKVWQPWYMEESDPVGKELPTRALREQRAKDRLAVARGTSFASSHHSMSPDGGRYRLFTPPQDSCMSYYPVQDDQPLDMSTKKRTPDPAPPQYAIPNSPSPPPFQQRARYLSAPTRPSVITFSHKDELLPPPPYSPGMCSRTESASAVQRLTNQESVQDSPSASDIDEHFRRSLGDKYYLTKIASPKTTDSVDDHFAKSLGDTWVKLQAKKRDESPPPAVSSSTISTKGSCPPPKEAAFLTSCLQITPSSPGGTSHSPQKIG